MTIHSMILWIPGIALILLGVLYLRKGLHPSPEPYRRDSGRSAAVSAERHKTANLTAGIAFVIAGIILIVFFAAVPSLLAPF